VADAMRVVSDDLVSLEPSPIASAQTRTVLSLGSPIHRTLLSWRDPDSSISQMQRPERTYVGRR
jgi:hypothetical protein